MTHPTDMARWHTIWDHLPTITTPQQLNTLPDGTTLRTANGLTGVISRWGWEADDRYIAWAGTDVTDDLPVTGHEMAHRWPVTIIWQPTDHTPTPSAGLRKVMQRNPLDDAIDRLENHPVDLDALSAAAARLRTNPDAALADAIDRLDNPDRWVDPATPPVPDQLPLDDPHLR